MDNKDERTWVQEIKKKTDGEIEGMIGSVSPFSRVVDRRVDFAILELQRRVQVENVGAIRELKKEIEVFRKSNESYSRRLSIFTIVLIIIGLLTVLLNVHIRDNSCEVSPDSKVCQRQLDLGIFGIYQWEKNYTK